MCMENLIKKILKEENLKSDLKQMVKLDGWESTYPLVGDVETLAQLAYDNNPMNFIDSLMLKKRIGVYNTYFYNDVDRVFIQLSTSTQIVEVISEFSDFLRFGFKLDKDGARNVIKDWLFDRHGIEINSIGKIYV
jgi:hypothetical protein